MFISVWHIWNISQLIASDGPAIQYSLNLVLSSEFRPSCIPDSVYRVCSVLDCLSYQFNHAEYYNKGGYKENSRRE